MIAKLPFFVIFLALLASAGQPQAKTSKIINIRPAVNLTNDGILQQEKGAVILLYVSAVDCPYCKKLEKEVLNSFVTNEEYLNKVILREMTWRSNEPFINFDNQTDTPVNFLKAYDIKVTPTLIFLDSSGKQLSPQIVGYSSNEFFWYYLDAAIRKSNLQLKQ